MKIGGKLGGRAAAQPPLAPDPEVIRALAGLLSETGLTEIEYAVGDHRIRVAREPVGKAPPPYTNGHASAEPQPAAPQIASPEVAGDNRAAAADHPGAVTSPIVGIAYLAPQPGAAPFVHVGDHVSEGQTLLIIEAMKVMNQIRSPRAGRLSRIFVEDAEPVEYGAALMLVE